MLDTDFVFQDFDWANYSPTDFNPSTFNEYIPAPDPPAYVPPAYAPPAYDPPASAPASVDYYDWAGYSPTDFAPATYNDYTPVQETVAYVPAPLEYDVGPDYNPPEYNPSSYNDYVPAQETVAYVPAQQTATYVPAPLEYTDWSGYNPPEYNPSTYNDYVPAQETATYVPAPLEYNVGPDYNPPEYNPSTNNEHVPVQDTATYVPAPLDMPSVNSIGYQNFGGEDFASNVTAPNNSLATTTNTTTRPWNHEAMFYQTMGYFLNVSTTHPQYAEYFKMYDLLTDRQVEYHPDRDYSRYGPYQAEWEALDFMTYSNSQARSLGVSWDVYQRSVIMAREAFINNLGTSVERYYSDGDYGSGGGFFGGDETVGRRSAFQAGEVSWSVSPALASEMNSGSVVNRGGQLGQWVKAGLPIDFDPNNDQPDLLQKRAWVPLGDGFGGGGATGSWEDLTKPKDRPNGDMPDGLYEIYKPFLEELAKKRNSVNENGYEFMLDGLGRPLSVTGYLKLTPAERDRQAQLAAGGPDRLSDDEGGHFIAARFGGPADSKNLFPQNANFNKSAYKAMENTWAAALNKGETVWVRIQPYYPSATTLRPETLRVEYRIGQTPIITRTLTNQAGN